MLHELHVRDLALIEDVWLEFASGMTVLTGETGAGKTALVGALKLLLGERADSQAVRSGAPEAFVEGRFTSGTDEVLAKRRVSSDGRSRCQLDGEIATVSTLAQIVGPLVDLHGQHEHQALLSPPTHVGYLDRWAGEEVDTASSSYREARKAYGAATTARDALDARLAEATRNADYLRFVLSEIDAVAPRAGEDEELEARLPALQHAERLSEAAGEASTLLRGDAGAIDCIARAAAAFGRVAGIDPELDALAGRLGEVQVQIDDLGMSARHYRDEVEHDPHALEQTLARLSALSGLKKKYGPGLQQVLALRDEVQAALADDAESEDARAAAQREVDLAAQRLLETGETLRALRRGAAPSFVSALTEAASDLAMEGAGFDVSFTELPFASWTADGPDRVEFLYAPAPGQPARPLARIASGGEVSRVMLALKGVLGEADEVETLVFDEVDAGIGGSTAQAVGRRLALLAKTHQVIVVTHLAQVAVFAERHLVVRKQLDGGSASTTASEVVGAQRVAEVARMLAGNDSVASMAHARELLEEASRKVTN